MNKTVLLITLLCGIAVSTPIDSEELFIVTQPDGSKVGVHYFGDDYFATAESIDGYTLTRDSDGWLVYAALSSDGSEYVATSEKYRGRSTRSVTEKSLRISVESMRNKSNQAREGFNRMTIDQEMEPFVSREGRSSRSDVSVDTITGLTIVIDFPDQSTSVTVDDIDSMLNGTNYTGYGNSGSIRDYFSDMSNGKLIYRNIVVTYAAKNNKDYYDKNLRWQTPNEDPGGQEAVQKVMLEALEGVKEAGFDFSQLSDDGKRKFIALNFLYEGSPSYGWGTGLWAHKWFFPPRAFEANGIYANIYQISPIRNELSIGTFIHESGHVLCHYPDLYPYVSGTQNLVRDYDVMSSSGGKTPPPFNPYFRDIMGWMNTVEYSSLTDGVTYSVPSDNSTTFRHSHPTNENESYYFENTNSDKWRKRYPGKGILMWKIDTDGSNIDPDSAGGKFLVDVVQADSDNGANQGDFFTQSTENSFNETSSPQANWYDGSFSGLDIQEISSSGEVMSFRKGNEADINSNLLTVENGSGDGFLHVDSTVTISAEPTTFLMFKEWVGDTQYVADPHSATTTVTMPDTAVTVTALLIPKFDSLTTSENIIPTAGFSLTDAPTDDLRTQDVGPGILFYQGVLSNENSYNIVSTTYSIDWTTLKGFVIDNFIKTTEGAKLQLSGENGVLASYDLGTMENIIDTILLDEFSDKVNLAEVTSLNIELIGSGHSQIYWRSIQVMTGDEDQVVGLSATTSQPLTNSLLITGVSAQNISVSIPVAGNYVVELFTVGGRVVSRQDLSLTAGINNVINGKNLASQLYLLRISGENHQMMQKVILQ